MRKIVFVFTLLLTLLLQTACDNGSVSDSSASKTSGLVKVSLAVDDGSSGMQKSISINDVNFTYFYKAVPQWSQNEPIQGSTDNQFVMIPGYSSGDQTLGYFSPGLWVFYVQVRINGTPAFDGNTEVTISSTQLTNVITVPVAKIIQHAIPGGVAINIKAPTIDEHTDELTMSWGSEPGESKTFSGTVDGGITTFIGEVSNLDPGTYTFTFSHSNASGRGGAIAADLHQNEMIMITGQLEDGEWELRSINLTVYTITVNQNQYGEVWAPINAAVPGDRVDFSLNPEDGAGVLNFSIASDGEEIQSIITNDFQYSFIMPAGNITINVEFGVTDEIEVEEFQTRFLYFYIKNKNSVVSFGREASGPGAEIEYKQKNKVKIWYDSINNKICWHSDADGNILKFKRGSLASFFKGTVFTSIDLTGMDTSKIFDMSSLFEDCVDLSTVNMGNINTEKVTNMSRMFCRAGFNGMPLHNTGVNAESQTDNDWNLAVSNVTFNTSLVEDMSYMFHACTIIDLSVFNLASWNVGNVEDMSYMFAGTSKSGNPWKYWYNKFPSFEINGVHVLKNWNTQKVKYFSNMFCLCNRVEDLDISGWKFNSVQYMDRMFERMEKLGNGTGQLVFPNNCDMKNLKSLLYTFGKCFKFSRENMATIVAAWDFKYMPADVFSQFIDKYDNTNDETIDYNNRIISNMHNTTPGSGHNFGSRVSMTTKDNRTLWIGGGNNTKSSRLTTRQNP